MAARILIVENDRERRDSVQELLKPSSYLVVEAADHEKTLSLLASEKFDLILLDITLPDKSGFGVLEFLEKNHIASKVMVVTGTVGLANVITIATPGAQEQVTKPFAPADLLKSIKHVLSDRSQTNLKLQITDTIMETFITLSDEDRLELQRIVRRQKTEQRITFRANILLTAEQTGIMRDIMAKYEAEEPKAAVPGGG